jgi:ribosomal protein L14
MGTKIWDSGSAPAVSNGDIVVLENGAAGELYVPSSTTISITGSAGNGDIAVFNDARKIVLDIPSSSKVVWTAKYACRAGLKCYFTKTEFITVTGDGELEIADGAEITVSHLDSTLLSFLTLRWLNFSIPFDMLGAKATTAIYAKKYSNVTVSGGKITAIGGGNQYTMPYKGTIVCEDGKVTVSGGEISFNDSCFVNSAAICVKGIGKAEISGGEICSNVTAIIGAKLASVNVSGGAIASGNKRSAILCDDVTVSGGVVIAESNELVKKGIMFFAVIHSKPENVKITGGTIIAFNSQKYANGRKDGLQHLPENAQVSWEELDKTQVIKYPGGAFGIDGYEFISDKKTCDANADANDMYSELEKIAELKKNGVIDENEFQSMKKDILAKYGK